MTLFSGVVERLRSCGLDADNLFHANGVGPEHVWRLPFLSCFGRTDGTVSVNAANVYPLSLQAVFATCPQVSHFKLAVEEDSLHRTRFMVYVEWRNGMPDKEEETQLKHMLHDQVIEALLGSNPEYRQAVAEDPVTADPQIVIVRAKSGPFAADAGRRKRSYVHKGSDGHNDD